MHLVRNRVFTATCIHRDPLASNVAILEKIGVAQVQGIGDLLVEVRQVEI